MERLESVFCTCEFGWACLASGCTGTLALAAFLLLR
jgi:hypothetical protein